MSKTFRLAALAILATTAMAFAQVPGIIQYQGRVTSHGTNFTGKGGFKFAIIETAVTGDSLWSNDGSSAMGSEPAKGVSVQVADGLFIVGLGDASLGNMMTIPASVFNYQTLVLRIWFDDGAGGYVALSPDQPITSVGFAMMAASVAPNSIGAAQLVDGAVTAGKIAPDAVAGVNLLNQTITGSKIAANSVTSTQIADTLTLQQLDLGSSAWDGVLNLWAAGANESRALLKGDNLGSLLHLKFINNSTGVTLSARSPGAKLNLWDGLGNETTLLGAGTGGGELTLFQINGEVGIFMDGDKSLYGNPTSTGAEIEVRNANGGLGVLLDGQGTSGGGLIRVMDDTGTTTAELLGAETAGDGAELRLRRANGITTMVFDAENDSEGGPRVDFNKGDGTSAVVFVPGGTDVTLGGGGIMRLGEIAGSNLGIDGDQILARTNGSAAPLLLNYQSGAVVHTTRLAINTLTPANGYSLSVNGKVICEELVVQNSNDWPDYVFGEDYELMSLDELEASIQKHKHLPGIPSAQKMGEDGIPLGEVQRQMMEKIEELTLYILQHNKRLQAQEEQMQQLRAKLDAAK